MKWGKKEFASYISMNHGCIGTSARHPPYSWIYLTSGPTQPLWIPLFGVLFEKLCLGVFKLRFEFLLAICCIDAVSIKIKLFYTKNECYKEGER